MVSALKRKSPRLATKTSSRVNGAPENASAESIEGKQLIRKAAMSYLSQGTD